MDGPAADAVTVTIDYIDVRDLQMEVEHVITGFAADAHNLGN